MEHHNSAPIQADCHIQSARSVGPQCRGYRPKPRLVLMCLWVAHDAPDFGIGYAVRERVSRERHRRHRERSIYQRSHLLPELRQVHSDF